MADSITISVGTTSNTTSEKLPSASKSKTPDSSGENDNPISNKTQGDITCLGYVLIFTIVIIAIIAFLVITPIIVIPVLPLLLSFYYVALIVQVFRADDDNQVGRLMGSLARWLWKFFALISIDLILCELIFGVTPSLKHRSFHGVSITRCIGVLVIICVFLTYSMLLRYYLGYRRLQGEHGEETVHLYEGIIGAINSLFYLFALFLIIRIAPILKEHTILGHPTQKWVRMIILLVLGHFAVRIFTSAIVVSFRKKYINAGTPKSGKDENWLRKVKVKVRELLLEFVRRLTGKQQSTHSTQHIVYYAEGLRTSFNFVFTSLLLLVTWILYFGSRLQRSSSDTARVYDFCLWTFACVLGSAFLWLVKKGIILRWKALVVYDRLNNHISRAATPLYLICIIFGIWIEKPEANGGEDQIKGRDEPNETTKCLADKQQSDKEEGKRTGKNRTTTEDPGKVGKKSAIKVETKSANRERENKTEGATEANRDEEDIKAGDRNQDDNEVKRPNKNETKEGEVKVEIVPADRERDGTSEAATEGNGDGEDIKDETEEDENKDDRTYSRGNEILLKECNNPPDTSDMARMARCFIKTEESLSKDSYVAKFVAKLRRKNTEMESQQIQVPTLRGKNLTKNAHDHLKVQLGQNYKLEDLEKWIMENHKNCLKLGRTIAGAMEVVNCLDNIMIGVLVAVVFIVWLLLTELATTRVLVLIASPIVGANFIFGQSCSTLFQGIMFAYVMHPFDVGDVCTIEGIQLEVKRIGVWKIIFSKVGATDDVVYSTTALANIRIVNHKGELDSNDNVEFKLQSTTKIEQIQQLKLKTEEYLDQEKGFKKHPDCLRLKDIGTDSITIVVHYGCEETKIKHIMATDHLQKKSEMKETFSMQVKKFLKELDITESTNTPSPRVAVNERKS